MSELPLTGGCLRGGVRFEVREALVSASYCHRRRCQRRTGTGASAGAWEPIPDDDLPRYPERRPPDA